MDIQELYNEYLKVIQINPQDNSNVSLKTGIGAFGYFDEQMNAFNPTMNIFKLMLQMQGFMASPKIISDEEYQSIEKQEYYHGFKELDHAKAFLTGSNYHLGSGKQLGTYFTEDKAEAGLYAEKKDCKSNCVLECKMGKARGGSYLDILNYLSYLSSGKKITLPENSDEQKIKEMVDFCLNSEGDERNKHDLYLYLTSTAQMLAVYLGYDYLYMQKGENTHLCVFNRGKIVSSPENIRKMNDESTSEK